MRFGHFDDQNKEYVITTPQTPLPWINYLGSEDFFSLVSNTAGGYSFYRDARLRRLTRYRYNSSPLDMDGHHIYIKDGDTVWNPGWQPTKTELDSYTCRHGLGYTILEGRKNGVTAQQELFVPKGDACELDRLTLRNDSGTEKELDVFSYVEFCLWDAVDDSSNFQRNFSTGEVEVEGSAVYHKTEYRERRDHYAVFWANCPISSFDTSRDAFCGVYGGPADPQAVRAGHCSGSIAHGWAPVGALHIHVKLAPGECRSILFGLGYIENPQEEKFVAPGVINKAGFGGALKNIGMGCGSRAGKMQQHASGKPAINTEVCRGCHRCAKECGSDAISYVDKKAVIDYDKCKGCGRCIGACSFDAVYNPNSSANELLDRKMAEYAQAVCHGRPHFHIALVQDISPNCDCHGENDAPILPDIGMFASFDPIALDQACVDACLAAEPIRNSQLGDNLAKPEWHCHHNHFMDSNPNVEWEATLDHGEKIGLGTRSYELKRI